ncbi:unnamed protein product [Strongylus vulgaris]|uniref:Uncharacterized protein n=1 Tax=Strongylus vulgaris TaxID=40348 RepID=A0A3P7J8R5_STRVU|nr:unnamed protein product [Strongylus vulgaris]
MPIVEEVLEEACRHIYRLEAADSADEIEPIPDVRNEARGRQQAALSIMKCGHALGFKDVGALRWQLRGTPSFIWQSGELDKAAIKLRPLIVSDMCITFNNDNSCRFFPSR